MSTPNKYHGSGRFYTAKELQDRRHALRPTYLMQGYSADPLKAAEQRRLHQCMPHRGKLGD